MDKGSPATATKKVHFCQKSDDDSSLAANEVKNFVNAQNLLKEQRAAKLH